MTWLADTPTIVVSTAAAMLPRLEAEESVAMANRIGMGTGSLTEEDQKALSREWAARTAQPDAPASTPNPAPLAQMGFAVRRIPKVRTPKKD